jgi:hypothetical protein
MIHMAFTCKSKQANSVLSADFISLPFSLSFICQPDSNLDCDALSLGEQMVSP